jgi:hypothetical protein
VVGLAVLEHAREDDPGAERMNPPPEAKPLPLPDPEQSPGPPPAGRPVATAMLPAAPEPAAYLRLVRAVSGRAALAIAFVWGLAEATLFVVVPDAWLGFTALYAPRRVVVTLLAIVAGAVAGAALMFAVTPLAGDGLTRILVALPGITPADLAHARTELGAQGAAAFLNGPLQGLPVKLYIHGAALDGLGVVPVLLGTALNRIARIGIFGLAMAIVGIVARSAIARWPRAVAAAYIVAWAIFYLAYWSGAAG